MLFWASVCLCLSYRGGQSMLIEGLLEKSARWCANGNGERQRKSGLNRWLLWVDMEALVRSRQSSSQREAGRAGATAGEGQRPSTQEGVWFVNCRRGNRFPFCLGSFYFHMNCSQTAWQ